MRTHAEESMFDLCIISRYLPDETDVFNVEEDNWEDELEDTICGFKIAQNKEAMDEGEVVMIDAELRLPFDVTIGRRDKIKLSYRWGEGILRADRKTFKLVGEPVHGHSAIVLKLVKDTEV